MHTFIIHLSQHNYYAYIYHSFVSSNKDRFCEYVDQNRIDGTEIS